MAETLLRLALTLLIAAQGSNVTPELRNQAISVATQAISVAEAQIDSATNVAPMQIAPEGVPVPSPVRTCTILSSNLSLSDANGNPLKATVTWDSGGMSDLHFESVASSGGAPEELVGGDLIRASWATMVWPDTQTIESTTTASLPYSPYYKLVNSHDVGCSIKTQS